jgi:hypothetical protein
MVYDFRIFFKQISNGTIIIALNKNKKKNKITKRNLLENFFRIT